MSALAIWPCPHWTARICETPPLATVFSGRGADVLVAREVAASQIQNTGVVVLFFKNLADQTDCSGRPLESALHGTLLGKLKLVYAHETLFLPVLLAQRHQPVVLQGRYEILAPAHGKIKVLLGGPICQTRPCSESQWCESRRS